MNIAITGSTGFIGSALSQQLKKNKRVTLFPFDKKKHSLTAISSLKNFVRNKDVIIHLAGIVNETNDVYEVNTLGTANLLEAIRLFGKPTTHFIFSSSFAVYEEVKTKRLLNEELTKTLPRNHYGMSKLLAEELIKFYNIKYNIRSTIFRIANPYGPSFRESTGIIAKLINNITANLPTVINGDGSQVRDFIYIDDLSNAFISILNSKEHFLILNLCSGKAAKLSDIVKIIEELVGKKAKLTYNKTYEETGYWIGDPTKAKKYCKFETKTTMMSGLKQTVKVYKK